MEKIFIHLLINYYIPLMTILLNYITFTLPSCEKTNFQKYLFIIPVLKGRRSRCYPRTLIHTQKTFIPVLTAYVLPLITIFPNYFTFTLLSCDKANLHKCLYHHHPTVQGQDIWLLLQNVDPHLENLHSPSYLLLLIPNGLLP